MPDFIPRADAALLQWAISFVNLIDNDPGFYGVSEEDAAELVQLLADYRESMTLAKSASTRGISTVFQKNDSRVNLVTKVRAVAKYITSRPETTNAMRLGLGLKLQGIRVRRRAIPSDRPGVKIIHASCNSISVKVYDVMNLARKGKPKEAFRAEYYYFAGEVPPEDHAQWTFGGAGSDVKHIIDLKHPIPPGTMIWVKARWQNYIYENGPFSSPTMSHIGYQNTRVPSLAA